MPFRPQVLGVTLGRPVVAPLRSGPAVVVTHLLGEPGAEVALGPPEFRATALDARTGRRLWERSLGRGSPPAARWQPGQPRPTLLVAHAGALLRLAGRPCVALLADRRLALLDPADGRPVRPPAELGFAPLGTPRFVEGDEPAVLLVRERSGGRLTLEAHRLGGKRLWQRDLGVRWPAVAVNQSDGNPGQQSLLTDPPEWPLVLPRGRKSAALVLVPDRDPADDKGWIGVLALDARTGELAWERRLGPCRVEAGFYGNELGQIFGPETPPTPPALPLRLALGPDLDGDGLPEVFTARVVQHLDSPRTRKNLLFVEPLAGRDGRPVWRTFLRQPLQDAHAFALDVPRWGGPGPDGLPTLVLAHRGTGDRKQPEVVLLSSSTGRRVGGAQDLGEPTLADLDGDGLPELLAWRRNNPADRGSAGELRVLRGRPPEAWRWWGAFRGVPGPTPATSAAYRQADRRLRGHRRRSAEEHPGDLGTRLFSR